MIFWDSSALVTLLVKEADTARRFEQLRSDSAMAVSWASPVECESAIQRRVRESALKASDARLARARLIELTRAWHEVAPTEGVRRLAVRLLRTHPLRAADALQLAAAITLANAGLPNLKFASADDQLNEAPETENLIVLS